MLIGIIASLLGAIGQALNYAVTKDCQVKYQIVGLKLLAGTFIFMGAMLTIPLVLLGYYHYFELSQITYLIRINVPFLLAQYFMFCALRSSDASIVSPLLALKIPVLCLITFIFFDLSLELIQYVAIALIIVIACIFSGISGTIRLKSLIFVVLATSCYVLSDIGITSYAKAMPVDSKIEQVLIVTCLNYIAAGLIFVPFCPILHLGVKEIWNTRNAAITWIVSATFCVIGFNLSGLVSGTIIQSLRGVVGVVISFVFYRHETVGSLSRKTFYLKVVLSIAMVLAVALFYV